MIMKRIIIILLVGTLAQFSAFAAIDFVGVFKASGNLRFTLRNTENQELSPWLSIGDDFAGCRILGYEAEKNLLIVQQGDQTLQIPFEKGRVNGGLAALSPAEVLEVKRAVLNNLRQICGAADQYYLENGVDHVELKSLVGERAYIRVLTPVDGEDYGKLILKSGTPLKIVTQHGIEISYEP